MDHNRALVDRALALLLAKDMAGFAELWAPDGVLEFPFAPPGYPSRLNGRAEVRDYVRDYPSVVATCARSPRWPCTRAWTPRLSS